MISSLSIAGGVLCVLIFGITNILALSVHGSEEEI